MTQLFNRTSQTDKRRRLRHDATYAEKVMWSMLRNKKIADARFCRQFSVGPLVLDFYCPLLRLAIEVDGSSHDTAIQQLRDRERQSAIEQLGISFLRFSDPEVIHNAEVTAAKVEAKIKELRSKTQSFDARAHNVTPPNSFNNIPSPLEGEGKGEVSVAINSISQ
jgi:very-short-patch-repair endonuclease